MVSSIGPTAVFLEEATANPVVNNAGCTPRGDNGFECAGVDDVEVFLGDRNDTAAAVFVEIPLLLAGGDGADRLEGAGMVDGEGGPDFIQGSTGPDVLLGADGLDSIDGNGGTERPSLPARR